MILCSSLFCHHFCLCVEFFFLSIFMISAEVISFLKGIFSSIVFNVSYFLMTSSMSIGFLMVVSFYVFMKLFSLIFSPRL